MRLLHSKAILCTLWFLEMESNICTCLHMSIFQHISVHFRKITVAEVVWIPISVFCTVGDYMLQKKPNFTVACRNPVRVVGTSVESWLSCVIFSYSSHWIVVHWKRFSTLWSALVSQLRENMYFCVCSWTACVFFIFFGTFSKPL